MPAHPLDVPVSTSLVGDHARLGRAQGRAATYDVEVSPFAGVPPDATAADWTDLARLARARPGGEDQVVLFGQSAPAPWTETFRVPLVQLVATTLVSAADAQAVRLGVADVEEMLDLVERTRPGPFARRTLELGGYLGLRSGGELVAMAGRRMAPPGYVEISAVCTDPAHRGRGLASRLVRAVAHAVVGEARTPFLHAAQSNTSAIRLYEAMGFTRRRAIDVAGFRAP